MAVTELDLRPSTVLGDWYANVLYLRRAHLVLCTNERSLLSVLVPLRDAAKLPVRLQEAAAGLFRRLGFPERAIHHELQAMAQVSIGRARNRSVLGSMNEIVFECRSLAAHEGITDPKELQLRLTEMPMLSLACTFTREQAANLLGAT